MDKNPNNCRNRHDEISRYQGISRMNEHMTLNTRRAYTQKTVS